MFTVKIWISNGQGDMDEETITSEKSLQAAKNQATRWIKKEFFASDIAKVKKDFETTRRADWTLVLKNPRGL